ncbi:MAG TPA: putative sulfate exporter family transporter [Jiangellaceae bacterium]|nr:putative sulfate exporter family transporter [Jiangellaceae bacterium]
MAKALPGLALVVVGAAGAAGLHWLVPQLALMTSAVLLGLLVGNLWPRSTGVPERYSPGIAVASRRFLRAGIVLLGLRLSLGDLADLGVLGVVVVTLVVAATFGGTWWLARRIGTSSEGGVLLGAGYAICGISAIAAVSATTRARHEDIAGAVAMVTLCGTLSIAVLPLAGAAMGLDPVAFGSWVGASVHDVGQVVATAATNGPAAVDQAVMVKLTRVVLLAPIVAGLAVATRNGSPSTNRTGGPPLVPLFVVGFLGAVVLRTTGWLPDSALEAMEVARTALFAAALFALGLDVRLDRLFRNGQRILVAGLVAWVLVAGLGLLALRWLS